MDVHPKRRDLILGHLEHVHNVARAAHRKVSRVLELEDVESAGRVGLVVAADRFEPARGVPFWAYAFPSVHQEIWNYIKKQFTTIKRRSDLDDEGRERLFARLERYPIPPGPVVCSGGHLFTRATTRLKVRAGQSWPTRICRECQNRSRREARARARVLAVHRVAS